MNEIFDTDDVLSIIFENTHMLVAYLNADLCFVKVNRAYAEADDKEPGYFVGKKHFDLYPNEGNEKIFRQVIATGEPYFSYAKPFEYKFNPERGTTHWDWSLVPSRNKAGDIIGAVLQLVDVTERIRTEEQLQIEQDFGDAVLAAANALVVVLDNKGRIRRFNKACEELTGYKFSEVENKYVWDFLLVEEEVEPVKEIFTDLTSSSLANQFTNHWLGKDGTPALINWNNSVMSDKDGNVDYVVSVGVDVTEERRALENLARSEQILESAQSIAHIGTWSWNLEKNFLEWSDEIYNIFGIADHDFGSTYEHFLEFVHEDDRPVVEDTVKRCLEDPEAHYEVDHRILRANGETRFVKETGKVYFNEDGLPTNMIGIVQDVTDQKRLEDELRINESRLRDAQRIAMVGSWELDLKQNSLYWTDEIYNLFEIDKEKFGASYDAFLEAIHPEDRVMVDAVYKQSLEDKKPYVITHRLLMPDGRIKWVEERGSTEFADDGAPKISRGTVQDVTEQRRVRDEIEHSQARFSAMFESISDAVVVADTQRRIVLVNEAALDYFGYTEEELVGEQTSLLYAEEQDFEKTGMERYNLSVPARQNAYEVQYRRKDGSTFWGETLGTKIESDMVGVSGFVGVIRDITDRKMNEQELQRYRERLEELVAERTKELVNTQNELVRKERLATLGQLTATVSHELRNPLGAMRPSLYLVQKASDPANDKMQQALRRLDRNISRCDHIIDELLDFTRITIAEKSDVIIDDWVRQLLEEQSLPAGIRLVQDLNLDGVQASVDSHRLRRALINVIENGIHAMQDDGGLFKPDSGLELKVFTRDHGDKIEIGVTDSGVGISDEVLPHIFEPLYSTKGFGVGLGMPTVKQIVSQHGGDIDINTSVGKGTTVRFMLPKESVHAVEAIEQ